MKEFDLHSISGLTEAEATDQLQKEGYNELPSTKRRSILAIVLEVVREPMFLLLVACGAIYLLLGDVREALMLLGFVFVVMGITIYQDRKTERALEALRDLTSPRALVIREGQQKRIPGRDVARSDILVLNEGDRPRDGRWHPNGNRQNRQGFTKSGAGRNLHPKRNPAFGSHSGYCGIVPLRPGDHRVWIHPQRLARWAFSRNYHGHGHAAGRIFSCLDHLPCPGRLAYISEKGAY